MRPIWASRRDAAAFHLEGAAPSISRLPGACGRVCARKAALKSDGEKLRGPAVGHGDRVHVCVVNQCRSRGILSPPRGAARYYPGGRTYHGRPVGSGPCCLQSGQRGQQTPKFTLFGPKNSPLWGQSSPFRPDWGPMPRGSVSAVGTDRSARS
jgi:hypothetical protein